VIKVGKMINRGKWDDQGGTSGTIKVGHKMIKRGTYGMIVGTSGTTKGGHLGSSMHGRHLE